MCCSLCENVIVIIIFTPRYLVLREEKIMRLPYREKFKVRQESATRRVNWTQRLDGIGWNIRRIQKSATIFLLLTLLNTDAFQVWWDI